MFETSGVYRLEVGTSFYVGSTRHLGARYSDHKVGLEAGEHPNPGLQDAFDQGGEIRMTLVEEVPLKPIDSKDDHVKRLKFREQLVLDRVFGTPGCCNRSSSSTLGRGIGEIMKQRWQDPEFRTGMAEKMRELGRKGKSVETRRRMAEAKRGSRNVKSLRCMVRFGGEAREFGSITEAAAAYGILAKDLTNWLAGRAFFPTEFSASGRRYPSLIGLVAMKI